MAFDPGRQKNALIYILDRLIFRTEKIDANCLDIAGSFDIF